MNTYYRFVEDLNKKGKHYCLVVRAKSLDACVGRTVRPMWEAGLKTANPDEGFMETISIDGLPDVAAIPVPPPVPPLTLRTISRLWTIYKKFGAYGLEFILEPFARDDVTEVTVSAKTETQYIPQWRG